MNVAVSRGIMRWFHLTAFLMLVALAAPSVSSASFEIVPGSLEIGAVDSEGNPDTRAGAHPDRFLVNYELGMSGTAMRDLTFEFGPGLTGSPFASPACSRAVFENEACPADTQVGIFTLNFGEGEPVPLPIYNIEPAPNQVADLGFIPVVWQIELGSTLRPTDYGLSMASTDMPQIPSTIGRVELWGIPADHVTESERTGFLTTPTECGPLKVVMRARSWESGAPWVSQTAETAPFTGCEDLPFEPEFGMQLSNPTADSPTGAHIDLQMAQHNDPDKQVSAYLKEVKIDLPHGMTVSPGSVEGIDACQDAQFGLGTESPVTCPLRSRIGTIEFDSPQLNETLTGSVFLGQEVPGERFRLFAYSPSPGIPLKALVKLTSDPKTGDLSAAISNLPPVSLSRLSLNMAGGSSPLLVTPLSCGPSQAQARFVPYGPQEPVVASTVVNVGSPTGCPNPLPFSPQVVAGSTQVDAGSQTGFSFTLTRNDGEQLIKRFSSTFPAGLNANLTTVDLCGDAAAAADTCPASSRIGSAFAEVGSGPDTGLVRGDVYLTGPYHGAPFGVAIAFDAKVGPFHLGLLAVRGVLRVDPQTGQVKLETDPLPAIFEGVPLRFRTVGLDLDRSGFLANPTSCKAQQLTSSITAVDGRVVTATNPFNIDACQRLAFHPRFGLAVQSGARQGGGSSKLSISIRTRKGDANVREFKVKFPSVLTFHSHGVRAVCARGDALEGLCPAASRVGTGVANTPLLREPLRGPVYLVQPKGGGFPDFWSSVEGMGVKIQLIAKSSHQGKHLVTEVTNLPDVPLSNFTMNLNGGKDGLFSVKGDPCNRRGARSTAPIVVRAQDGAYRKMHVPLDARCSAKGRKRRG